MSVQLKLAELVRKTHINLSFNGLNDGNIDVLVGVLQKSEVLKELNLWSNEITLSNDKLTDALAANTTIRVLSLGSNRIDGKGGMRLAAALKANTSLQEVHLGDNQIGDEGALGFADALMVNTSLQKISLYGNWIGDEGAESLATSFKANPSLRVIWLHENKIGDKGGEKLADALEHNQDIGLLFLLDNRIGSEVTGKINTLLRDPKRKTAELENFTATKEVAAGSSTDSPKKDEAFVSQDVVKQLNDWGNHISENFMAIMSPKMGQLVTPVELCQCEPQEPPEAQESKKLTIIVEDVAVNVQVDDGAHIDDEIEALKAVIRVKEEELKARDEELKSKGAQDDEIASLKAEIAQKNEMVEKSARKLIPSALAAKDATIAALNTKINEATKQLAEKDEAISEGKRLLVEKDEAIVEVTKRMAEKDEETTSKITEISSKDEAIVSLEEIISLNGLALEQKDKELAAKDTEIATKEQEMEQALASRDEQIASLQADVSSLKAAQVSPLKQLELFIASKDEIISSLEAIVGQAAPESPKPIVDEPVVPKSPEPIVDEPVDVTSDETQSTLVAKQDQVVPESNLNEQPEDTVADDARDDSEIPVDPCLESVASSNRVVEIME